MNSFLYISLNQNKNTIVVLLRQTSLIASMCITLQRHFLYELNKSIRDNEF